MTCCDSGNWIINDDNDSSSSVKINWMQVIS